MATGLNNLGQVVGFSSIKAGDTHAFLWSPGQGMRDLGTLGGTYSRAMAVNDRGEVVGISIDAQGMPTAFLWDEETGMHPLPAGGPAEARAIDDDGMIAGVVGTTPVCWLPGEDSPRPLGHVYIYGTPEAVAAGGRIAGSSDFASGGGWLEAVIWNPDGTVNLLGGWSEAGSEARDMNEGGEVVGLAARTISDPSVAVLWDSQGEIHDLEQEITGGAGLGSPSEWVLQSATGINGRGDIVGVGIHGERRQAFLLRRVETVGLTEEPAPRSTAGTGSTAALTDLRVVPNPSSGPVRIEFLAGRAGQVRLEIFDPSGRRVALLDRSVLPGPVSIPWSPGAVPAGTWFARVSASGSSAVGRLVRLPR